MKRHLTVLAASAMLAAFAGMAMAEDAPAAAVDAAATVAPVAAPVKPDTLETKKYAVVVNGKLDYAVEYDALKGSWTNGADSADETIGDAKLNVVVTVPSAEANPKLTFTLNPMNNGTDSGVSTGTIEGKLFDTTIKLGRVDGNWDGGWSAGRTEGPGAYISKKLGNVTFDAFTTQTVNFPYSVPKTNYVVKSDYFTVAYDSTKTLAEIVGASNTILEETLLNTDTKGNEYYYVTYKTLDAPDTSKKMSAYGGKANIDLGNGNSAYGFFVVDQDQVGGAVVGGTYASDMANLTGKAGFELGKGTGSDKAWTIGATVKPFDGLTFTGNAWEVDNDYAPKFRTLKDGAWLALPSEEHFDNADWIRANGYTDEVNVKLGANLELVKDKDTVVSNAYLNYANWAKIEKNNYVQLGGKNTDIYLDDAYVKFINNRSNEYAVTFSNTISGVKLTAQGKVKTWAPDASSDDSLGKANWTYGLLKAEKTFDWLKTWVALEKAYPSSTDTDPVVHPKVGASVSVLF